MPLGSTSVSASGGAVTLVGRANATWTPVAESDATLADAVALLTGQMRDGAHPAEEIAEALPSHAPGAPRFEPGQEILWRYGRVIETARVIRDDERGLVCWIPPGAARLEPVPADGRRAREIPLDERFRVPWIIRESSWSGQGIVRVAPAGKPWSVWFFRQADGSPAGAYVNLELPHLRTDGQLFSRDLVLDLWVDAEHAGSEDIWLKDADELCASVAVGRFTPRQAEAVRILADHAAREFITGGRWPLDEGWQRWNPDAALNRPIPLPKTAFIEAARRRSGESNLDG